MRLPGEARGPAGGEGFAGGFSFKSSALGPCVKSFISGLEAEITTAAWSSSRAT